MSRSSPLVVVVLCSLLLGGAPADEPGWERLEPGLDFGTFTAPTPSPVGDSAIRVLRVDPARFDLVLISASAQARKGTRTARGWAEAHGLLAAINASMYRTDHLTSVAYMRDGDHVNNGRRSADKDFLVFGRRGDGPRAAILDRGCDDVDEELVKWTTAVQSIRMLSCDGRNVWSQQPKQWSHAAIGVDGDGRVLFVHARSPWSTHDFIDHLRALPLDLKRLQYAEGGPEAQLFVGTEAMEVELVGSYETGFYESDDNARAWPVPNVVGVTRRSSAP